MSRGKPVESDSSTTLILRDIDETAAGSSESFLSSRLRYTKDETSQDICFVNVNGEDIGVMMGWETPIMLETVQSVYDSLPERDNLKVLNVGFGLGIVSNQVSRQGVNLLKSVCPRLTGCSKLSPLRLHNMSSLNLTPMFCDT